MLNKIAVAIFVLVLLGVGGWYLLNARPALEEPALPPPPPEAPPTTSTYASSTLGLSLVYPKEYTVNETYAYDQFGKNKLIQGVQLAIPAALATGTTLAADSYLSVEWLPRAKKCTADIFLPADVKTEAREEGGVGYSVASSTEAAAGNRYEETVYAVASSTPCTAIRYFLHATNIDNYPSSAVREYDRAALLETFDQIRRSLKWER